jgi:hypothetical protein
MCWWNISGKRLKGNTPGGLILTPCHARFFLYGKLIHIAIANFIEFLSIYMFLFFLEDNDDEGQ